MSTDATLPLTDRKKATTRTRIEDALLELLASGGRLNHDSVAERAGVSRRTIYRYFPDRDVLLSAATERVRALAGPQVDFPTTEEALLTTLRPIHEGFDRIAPLATLVRSTPQGRTIRLAEKKRRVRSYTAAAANAVSALSTRDAKLATAMLQFLHTSGWLEMRDYWDLSGTDVAEVSEWAIKTLLADLKKRGSKPLSEGL